MGRAIADFGYGNILNKIETRAVLERRDLDFNSPQRF
jgi:hypothetical protein